MIIDGSSLLFRAFCASSVEVCPWHANQCGIWFLTMLIKLYEEIKPDYIAVAFDKGRQTFRTEMYMLNTKVIALMHQRILRPSI